MEDKLCLYSGTWFFCRWFGIENIFFDCIKEIAILTGGIIDKQFFYRYCLVPRIPIVGNAARTFTLFDFRSMILGSDFCPIHIQYLHTTTGTTSNTKILATYFTKGTQAIRPSCTQAAMATHGKILYHYEKKILIGCLICQDILYIESLLSVHTKIFQKKSKRIVFSCPSDEFAVGNSGSTLVFK